MDNQPPRDPPVGPSIPSIEDEFDQLNVELKRIAAMPAETPEQRNALLIAMESFRDDWKQKIRVGDNGPAWRRSVDSAIERAFDGLIAGLQRSGDGSAGLNQELLKEQLAPVFEALTEGLRRNLVEKFGQRPPPGAPPPKVDATDVAAMLATLFGPPAKKK